MRVGSRPHLLRDSVTAFAMLALIALIAAKLNGGAERSISAAFFVIDGDTLGLKTERLRLSGIDAPELAQHCRDANGADWACGQAARQALAALLAGAGATCRGRAEDRYGRLLVVCATGPAGPSINSALVRQGLAVAYGGYETEESAARAERRGLWAGAFERPQDWRRTQGLVTDEPVANSWLGLLRRLGGGA